jgi:hypothetical protein
MQTDFGGLWAREVAVDKTVRAKSRTGYLVMYALCPIIWTSQLQTKLAMSTTEAEYLALSTALRNTIPLMRLVKAIQRNMGLPMSTKPTVHCTLFEDNLGAVELSNVPKMHPHTKHINPKYHHFCKYVYKGMISIVQIRTTKQLADIFTKNLPRDLFLYFRGKILGW